MNQPFYHSVANDLTNFPLPVIEQWFEHAVSHGWPPTLDAQGFPIGRWGTILANRTLGFWRGVTWALERARLYPADLDDESETMAADLRNAYLLGLPHPQHIPIADSSARIHRFVGTVLATGRMPVPPILFFTASGFEVLDGFHRLAALFHVQTGGGKTEPLHDVWVARG